MAVEEGAAAPRGKAIMKEEKKEKEEGKEDHNQVRSYPAYVMLNKRWFDVGID